MSHLIQYTISGIALGSMYGLIALSLALIYKATDTLNFAQGALMVLGAFFIQKISSMPFILAFLIAAASMVLLMLVIQWAFVAPMMDHLGLPITVMTIGLEIGLLEVAQNAVGDSILPLRAPWGSGVVRFAGATLPVASIVAIGTALVLIVAFGAWLRYSKWGVVFRSATDRPRVAELFGVRLRVVAALAWAIAGFLTLVPAYFLSTFPAPGVSMSLPGIGLRALPAIIIGGLDSLEGALIGGLMVGLTETYLQGYASDVSFLGSNFHIVGPYLLMFVVLLFRPNGLLGTSEVSRV